MRLFAALALGACRADLETIDLSDRDDVLAFAVALEEGPGGLRVRRVTPIAHVVGGRLAAGERPEIALVERESEAALVEVPTARLAADPSYETARVGEVSARIEPPPAGRTLAGDPRAPIAVRSLAGLASITGSEPARAAILGGVTFLVPVDPEWCRPTERAFEPFGASASAIASNAPADDELRRVVRDGDRAILLARGSIHVLARGGSVDGPGESLDLLGRLGATSARAGNADLALGEGGRIVAGSQTGERTSAVSELIATATIAFVRTATVIEERISAVAASGRRLAFVTGEGTVYVERPGGFDTFTILEADRTGRAQGLAWTGDDARPLVTSSVNFIHVLDAASGLLERRSMPLRREGELVNLNALLAVDGVVYGFGSQGYALRLETAPERMDLELPPRSALCSPSGTTEATQDHFSHAAATRGYLFLLRESCNSVIAVRFEDRCVSFLPVEGEPSALDHDAEGLLGLHAADGIVVVAGRKGRVYRLEL
jgi:hypothetical protein